MKNPRRLLPTALLVVVACAAPPLASPVPAPHHAAEAQAPRAAAPPMSCKQLPDPEPRSSIDSVLLSRLAEAALGSHPPPSTKKAPVKVGVLHSLTGSMARDESVLAHTVLATLEHINGNGGVLGHPIEPVVVDPESNWPITGESAAAFHAQGANPIFGLSLAIAREYVKHTMRPGDLLFYPAKYEGGERATGFYYTGAGARQHALPTAEYLMSLGARAPRRWALLGTDHSYPRKVAAELRAFLKSKGVPEDSFLETYVPFGHRHFDRATKSISQLGGGEPTVVFTFLTHEMNARFATYVAQCASPDLRVVSFSATRDDLTHPTGRQLASQWIATSYLSELDNPNNVAFKKMWRDYVAAKGLPAQRGETTDETMESSFVGIQLWKLAVEAAGAFDGDKVERALAQQSYLAPSGFAVKFDPRTRDLYRPLFIGEVQADASVKLVHSSGKALAP